MDARRPPLSRRTGWDLAADPLSARVESLRLRGQPLLDLTESNPTRCGLSWPPEQLKGALAPAEVARYDPSPRGPAAARVAVCEYLAGRGATVAPEHVVLTASTSEGYAMLLKLLCDPGDEVLVGAPGYPLLDVLCDLECVRAVRYPLRHDGTWHVDLPALRAAVTGRTRAVVVVSPSNPTGATLDRQELAWLEALCAERGLALVGDEVFADCAEAPPASVATLRGCLAFHLAGLSKTCGLPQVKAAWIAAAGPAAEVERALARLEMIADAALSVSGPAQLALPGLLAARERFLGPLRRRLAANRGALTRAVGTDAPFNPLRGGGSWSAVLRVGELVDEQATCLELLERGVLVQPGYYYDFERPGHLVVSLLPEPEVFERGISCVARWLRSVL